MIVPINVQLITTIVLLLFSVFMISIYMKYPKVLRNLKLHQLKAELMTEMDHDESYYLNNYTKENANSQIAYKSSRNNIFTAIKLIDAVLEVYTVFMNILNEMYDIAMDASNDTLTDTKRYILNKKFEPLILEIDRLSIQAEFNGIKLIDGTAGDGRGNIMFHVLPKTYKFSDVMSKSTSSGERLLYKDFL